MLGAVHALGAYGMAIGGSPRTALAKGAHYVNVSQFPLWVPAYFRWLEDRTDVRAVFFIHDVLPIEMPEYFREAEYSTSASASPTSPASARRPWSRRMS